MTHITIKTALLLSFMATCPFISLATEGSAIPALLRAAHISPNPDKMELWAQLDLFDQSLDVVNYSKKLGAAAKPSQMVMGKLGGNLYLDPQWLLRSELMYGSQTIVRPLEPRRTDANLHAETVLLQWHDKHIPLVLEVGYVRHAFLPSGFSKYQTANSTIVAAPGKQLITSSAKDSGWILNIAAPMRVTDSLQTQIGMEMQRSTVQATYTSYDPAILASATFANRAPQTTPWHESQLNLALSLDYTLFSGTSVGMDFKHVQIQRSSYIPRKGFQDYTSTQMLDVWLFQEMSPDFSLIFCGHANRHYLLGEIPAAYNSGINDKFKHPFGYLSVGITYK